MQKIINSFSMIHYSFLFVNTALIMSCIIFAVVFLVLPLPNDKELKNYRISLYLLAGAYSFFAILKFFVILYNINVVSFIPAIPIIVASLQASLFTLSLVNLINPLRINKRFVFLHLLPILLFVIPYAAVWRLYGNPVLTSLHELSSTISHPAVILRLLLALYYVVQLAYLTVLFLKEIRRYNLKLDKYCSDNYNLSLQWVKNSFIAALIIGLVALGSVFTSHYYIHYSCTLLYAFFYTIFGVFYIQYPRTYQLIKPVLIETTNAGLTEIYRDYKHYSWEILKEKILKEKYYLVYGVSIIDIAQYLSISRTTLSNYINQNEKKNFNAWINFLRVEEAQKLLIEFPDYSLIKIAESIGYSELSNFCKQFKLVTNESPSVWRQKHLS